MGYAGAMTHIVAKLQIAHAAAAGPVGAPLIQPPGAKVCATTRQQAAQYAGRPQWGAPEWAIR